MNKFPVTKRAPSFLFSLIVLLVSCGSDNIDVEIVNGYTYQGSLSSGMITKGSFLLHNVVGFQKNQEYIVAVRFYSPNIDTKFAALSLNEREDTVCEYWIIVHDRDVVLGPLTLEQFKVEHERAYSLTEQLRPFHSQLDNRCFTFEEKGTR